MYTRLWHERVASELQLLPRRTLLICSRESGIDYAIHRLHGLDMPRVNIWINKPLDYQNSGEILSEAVAAGLGTTLFGKSANVAQGLKAIGEYQQTFGPITIVVGWAHLGLDLVRRLTEGAHDETRFIVVSEEGGVLPGLEAFSEVTGSFLRMEFAEAVSESRGSLPDPDLEDLYDKSGGNFATFKVELMSRLGGDKSSLAAADFSSWGEAVAVDGVLDALVHRERWADAFDLACSRASERLVEFIDQAGNYYSNKGSFSYFWARLNSLPPDVKQDEKVAYWLFDLAPFLWTIR